MNSWLDLFGSAEQVGVVLGQAADAEHAVQFARLLVAVDGAELRQPHRQVAVGAGLCLVHLHVVRAVHGLEKISLLLLLPRIEVGSFSSPALAIG